MTKTRTPQPEVTPRPKYVRPSRSKAAIAARQAVADLSPEGQDAAITSGIDLLLDEPYPANPVEDDRPEDEVEGNHAPAVGFVDVTAEVVGAAPAEVLNDKLAWITAAKAECASVKAWVAAGSVGDKPPTPNLDAGAPSTRKAAKPERTPRTRAPRAEGEGLSYTERHQPAGRPRLHVDGVPMRSLNTLALVAYYHTKGVEPGTDRVPAKRFRTMLADAGITEPTTTEWSFTLPNSGKVIASVFDPQD